jgi:signal transduction histidine kinase
MQTASPPASNPLLNLLDIVDSPLLLFNPDGRVVFSNRAAKAMPERPGVLLGSDPNVRSMVNSISQGKVVVNNEMRVEALSDNGIARLICHCAPKPVAGLVAMALSRAIDPHAEVAPANTLTQVPDQRLSIQQIMELLRDQLVPPIETALKDIKSPEPSDASESLQSLHERLTRIVDLVNVFGEDVLIGDERMVMVELVRGTCESLAQLIRSQGVSVIFEGADNDLPPVYGSERLMKRALHECIHNAIVHSRREIQMSQPVAIEVSFRASGQHLLISIRNLGALNATALERHAAAIFRPTALGQAGGDSQPTAMQIGLPLTQRILQLHGGRLRIGQEQDEELDVMLELPTGAPLRNSHQLDMLQAQIYAEDLSKLMARTRNRRSE